MKRLKRLQFVHAMLSKSSQISLVCELPSEGSTPAEEQQFKEFVEMAKGCGAWGFYVEEVRLAS